MVYNTIFDRQELYAARIATEGFVDTPKCDLQRRYNIVPTQVAHLPPNATPGQVFERLFTRDMFEMCAEMTTDMLYQNGGPPQTTQTFMRYTGGYLWMCFRPQKRLTYHWKEPNKPEGMLSKNRWLFLHGARYIPTEALFAMVTSNTRNYLRIGSDVAIDELQTNFGGDSPCLNFNINKPHPWGHLVIMAAVKLANRSVIVSAKPRIPSYHTGHPTTHQVVRDIDDEMPTTPICYTTDSYYNTKGVRALFAEKGRFYIMAGKTDWIPHMWRTLHRNLPYLGWRQYYRAEDHTLCVSYFSGKKVNTMSNAFAPFQVGAPSPVEPPLYQAYRNTFNLIDLWDRIYFKMQFPHRQEGWENNLFDVVLKIALINAWVLFSANSDEDEMDIDAFGEAVAQHLLNYTA